ncbi:hypothetical protein B0H12DRAFT_1137371 [Mycena haematopus]|nr:hypothetical protein B0H12DRAFT_1137371 [Mycena haematopus]
MTTLPPTTHALRQTDRAHLIHSTRKLGALLGETPLLLEPSHSRNSSIESTSSIQSKRSARIFPDPPPRTSSLAPADADPSTPSSTKHVPRPVLLLRLASPRPTSLVSPISPAFQISPLTPTFVVDRRKKMAKLVRTLGTNVPPELVFSTAPKSNIPSPAVVPALLSALSPAHEPTRNRISSASSALASPTREAAASRSYYSADEDWVDLTPSSYPPSPRSPHHARTSPAWDATFADDTRVSTSTRSTDDARYLSRHYEFSAPVRSTNSPNPSSSSRASSPDDDSYDLRPPPRTYRKEQGWSGEWSGARGMDDVVKSLRGLRSK